MTSREQERRGGRVAGAIRWLVGSTAALALAGIVSLVGFAWLLPQSFAAGDDGPVRLLAVAFFVRVFQFHLGVALSLVALTALAARWRRTAALGLLSAATLLTPYLRDHAPKRPPAAAGPTFRVMTMNLYFENRDEAAIVRAIDQADPDVIVMPELTQWSMREIVEKHLGTRYKVADRWPGEGAAIILTRLPFRVGEPVTVSGERSPTRRPIIVTVDDAEIDLYGVHLVSPGRWWLVGYNRDQTAGLARIARTAARPTIIAGDFNFTALTPNAYELRRAGLRTTHELVGRGLGNTWGPRWYPTLFRLPGVRIDHVYLSRGLTATHHAVGADTGSDHRPVIADVSVAR